jgi:hypothetical protein
MQDGNQNGSSMIFRSRLASNYNFVKFVSYVDNNRIDGSGWVYVADKQHTWQTYGIYDPGFGSHIYTTCTTSTNDSNYFSPYTPSPGNGFNGANDTNAGDAWACKGVPFYVNRGPDGTLLNNPTAYDYKCRPLLQAKFNDAEGDPAYQHMYARPNGNPGQQIDGGPRPPGPPAVRPDNAVFTSDDVYTGWNGNGPSLSDAIRDGNYWGQDIDWFVRTNDAHGVSDLDDFSYNFLATKKQSGRDLNLSTGQWPGSPGLRWGPENQHRRFHLNTAPDLTSQTTKEFFDISGNKITSIRDGQFVRVKLTIKNSGETPTSFYKIHDYLGSARDFTKPSLFLVNGFQIPDAQLGIQKVKVTNLAQDSITTSSAIADGDKAWQINFDSLVSLPNTELAPGETIHISYFTRADRNQNVTPGDQTKANYSRSYTVGGATVTYDPNTGTYSVTSPNQVQTQSGSPSTFTNTRTELADVHTWFGYQESPCDANLFAKKIKSYSPGTIFSPFVRGGRGDIHTNGNAVGYDSLGGNATFLLTASGALSHFTGNAGSYPGYQGAGRTVCKTDQGLDWRTLMIKNVNKLQGDTSKRAGPVPSLLASGLLDGAGKNIWIQNGDLTIGGAAPFRGKGTILVTGNLNITGNLSYGPDVGSVNSLGIVVLGNVTIAPSVTNIVGSYFVLDGLSGGSAACDSTKGIVSTGASNQPLNVDGLMVARDFKFERYFMNVPAATGGKVDPAENIYYDGRVVANPPPGFDTFRDTTLWYEVTPQ